MTDKALSSLTQGSLDTGDYFYGAPSGNSRKIQAGTMPFSPSASPTFTNLTQTGYHDLTEISEPASPAANVARCFARDVSGRTEMAFKRSDGTVVDLLRGVVSVKDYGASGDGTTDDTTAISTAFNAGGIVYVPSGTYSIDPTVTVSTPAHIIMHPEAILKRRSATADADSYLISFASGASGSVFEGGTIDGDRDSYNQAAFGSDPQSLWPGVYLSGASRITIRNMRFVNHRTQAMWIGNSTGHLIENIQIEDCDRALLFQSTDDSTCRNVFATGIGNDGINQYQHAVVFRNLNRCVIENIRIDGYAPDAQGEDPYPVAFTFERIFSCKLSGFFLNDYTGTETRNVGITLSNVSDTSLSDAHLKNVFWGIKFLTVINSTVNGFSIDGNFKTASGADGAGLEFLSGGVFQNVGDSVDFDTRANSSSKQNMISDGIIIGCEIGVNILSSNISIANVISNGNTTYGFQCREATNNAFYSGHPKQRVENIIISNCQARFNGFNGILVSAGNQIQVNGGLYCDNGWDTSLGSDFRVGLGFNEDATAGGVDDVSITNVFAGDTQTFSKTGAVSFNPGSTVNDQFTISLVDPDQIAIGQYISLVNANGSGDETVRVIALNLDEATVETSGSVTFSETGNLTSLTGTLSSSGNTVTGSGTAFTTEIVGGAWIKVDSVYHHVSRVNSDTSMVVFPAPATDWSGESAEILLIDVDGIPSQQYGIYANSDVNGDISLVNFNTNGVVTGPASLGAAGDLDILTDTEAMFASAGVYSRGGNVAINSTDLTQGRFHVAQQGADGVIIAISGQSSGRGVFSQFGSSQFWQTNNINLAVGTNTAHSLALRTSGTTRLSIASGGAITVVHPTAGFGYGTGAGGAVTQTTNKTTGVTLNNVCGQITMDNAALGAGASVNFTLTNSAIAATDVVLTVIASGGTANAYTVTVTAVAAGSCSIRVTNTTGGSLSEAPVITFIVYKAVIS